MPYAALQSGYSSASRRPRSSSAKLGVVASGKVTLPQVVTSGSTAKLGAASRGAAS